MNRDHIPRLLRLMVACACLVVSAFVTLLWVRSYLRHDDIKFGIFNYLGSLESLRGECGLVVFDPESEEVQVEPSWSAKSFKVTAASRGWYESNEPFTSIFVMRWQFWPNGLVFGVSYWFVVLVSATLAAVLFTKRFHRFSLRALLVAMTLVGFLLGMIVLAKR